MKEYTKVNILSGLFMVGAILSAVAEESVPMIIFLALQIGLLMFIHFEK